MNIDLNVLQWWWVMESDSYLFFLLFSCLYRYEWEILSKSFQTLPLSWNFWYCL